MPGQGIITIGTKQWSVSLATTPEELARGLGGLYAIPAGTGMLFDTEGENILSVTTAPMLFSIDIAFLNTSLVVNGLALGVAPGYLVATEAPASYFLEVNAGEVQGIHKGQQAALQMLPGQATSWTNQLVSAVASVLALGLAVKVVGAIARQVLPKSKPKAELFGPRGERLLPETKAPRRQGRQPPLPQTMAIARLIGPTGRQEVPKELEFFPDSPEQCCSSVDGTGLRPQLDRAFREAIARARRKGG